MNDIPMETEEDSIAAAKGAEVPAEEMKTGEPSKKQTTPEKMPEVHQRTSNNDGIDLYLVKKDLLGACANPDAIEAFDGRLRLERLPKHEIVLGKGWIRRDGDACPEHPSHAYVVARRVQ